MQGMQRTFLLLAAAAALLLPSCVQWEIGRSIRECAETRVGIDPQKCLVLRETKAAESVPGLPTPMIQVLVAPEVTYSADSPLINGTIRQSAAAEGIAPTGGYRYVEMTFRKFGGWHARVGERCDVAGPGKLRAWKPAADVAPNEFSCGTAEKRRSRWYPLAAVAAAPFDFALDPALSVVSTSLCWVGGGAYYLASYPFRQRGRRAPEEVPAVEGKDDEPRP